MDNKELIEKIDGEEAQAVEAVPATPTVKKRRRKTLKEQLHFSNFLMLTVAGIINAFGVTVNYTTAVFPERLCFWSRLRRLGCPCPCF